MWFGPLLQAGAQTQAFVTLPTLVRPSSDTAAGAWVSSTGGTLASCIGEPTYSDAEYISVDLASTCELVLTESAYPGGASQTLSYRASSVSGSTLTVTLKQGSTTIMTRIHALTSTVTDYVDTLTSGEIASIVAGPISVTLAAS